MSTPQKHKKINGSHFLLTCRFDVWLRLLGQNHFHILPRKIPQALLISLSSLFFFPFALLERLLIAIPVKKARVKQPLFILGHWRSGTTYLQNVLSRDEGFGYFDPVSTDCFNNSVLLRPILKAAQNKVLANARPMDNLQYANDLPMEEVFSIAISSDLAIVEMLVFPENAMWYLDAAFVDELPDKHRQRWRKVYDYILRKQTWLCKQKPLLLKSPDSTARAMELYRMYPDARFIMIHRNPYAVIRSTINMFKKLFDLMTLQQEPDEEYLEDMIVATFVRIYRKLFREMEQLPDKQYIDIKYEDFEQQPLTYLEEIYQYLHLPGFASAKTHFIDYIESQKGYQKNHFDYSPRLIEKINQQCGFYFARYGYDRIEPQTEA